jgi:5-methyltetrahydrofolate--homocysteine methyltransferase
MGDFLTRLQKQVVIFDGAMGTMLQAEGLLPGECPELWNVERPEIVQKIHRAYFEAGAQVVETNTFGANPIKLAAIGLEGRTHEFNYQGARLAKTVAPPDGLVAGSVSPTGKFLEPLGDLTYPQVVEIYKAQIGALAEGGADLICIETMSDIEETAAAIQAARAVCSLPVIATMTFNLDAIGFRTIMGISPEIAAIRLKREGVDIIGSNCGQGMEEMILLMKQMRPLTSLPLIAQPNAGLPQLSEGKVTYPQSPEDFAQEVPELLQTGINVIGGCCGTTPEHIRLLAEKVREEGRKKQEGAENPASKA